MFLPSSSSSSSLQGQAGAGAIPRLPAGAARSPRSRTLPLLPPSPTRPCRGKQVLALYPDCLLVRTPKADLAVPWGAIMHVAVSMGCMRLLA